MQKMKKTLAVVLAVTMAFSFLTGCGSKDSAGAASNSAEIVNQEGFPIVKEPITLTMMGPDVGIQNWEDMQVIQKMEEMTGVKMTFRNAPLDSFDTKKNLVFASGDLPDIFYGASITRAEEVNYGAQGMIIPLEDLIDQYAPNLKKILDENPDIRKSITTPDGHIYTLPTINLDSVWYRGPMWYNGEFLEALGYTEVPQTVDELYTYLKRVKNEDPNGNGQADEIPLESVKLDDIRMWLLSTWGIYNEVYYADDDGTVHYTPMEEGYKEYLTFLNKLWNEGLMDIETFSQTDEQKKSKGKNNQLGLFADYHAYFTLGGEPSEDDPMYFPVRDEEGNDPKIAKNPGISTGTFAITSANKYPEATMRWIDYKYSYEGSTLFEYGEEGTLWKYTDEANNIKEWVELPEGQDREETRATLTPDYGFNTPTLLTNDNKQGLLGDFEEWLNSENEEKIIPFAKNPYPGVYLQEDEQAQVTALLSDLNTYVKQMEAKFVTGQEPLSNWDNYVATLKKMGSEKIVEVYQAAYDRWDSNK